MNFKTNRIVTGVVLAAFIAAVVIGNGENKTVAADIAGSVWVELGRNDNSYRCQQQWPDYCGGRDGTKNNCPKTGK